MKKSKDILVGEQYALFRATGLAERSIHTSDEAISMIPDEQEMLFDTAPLDRYDTKDAREGDMLIVHTDRGRHVFVKDETNERSRALEGWRREDAEHTLGVATRLVICEANKLGASIRTNTIVMAIDQELTSIDTEGLPTERQTRNLGLIANMTLQRFPQRDQPGEIDFDYSRHVIAA